MNLLRLDWIRIIFILVLQHFTGIFPFLQFQSRIRLGEMRAPAISIKMHGICHILNTLTQSVELGSAPHSRRREMAGRLGNTQMGQRPTLEDSLVQARWRGVLPPLPLASTPTKLYTACFTSNTCTLERYKNIII